MDGKATPYIEALSKDEYTIYAFDAPSHGLSGGNFLSVPLYGSLIRDFVLNTGDIHAVIGHSVGSFSLLYTLYQFPLLPIRKIILLAPPGEATDFMDFYQKTLRLSQRTRRLVTEHFKSVYNVGPEFFSTTRFAASINVQGLIIHDQDDDETPHHYAEAIHRAWKRSTLVTTKGFGHNLRSPAVVNAVVDYITEDVRETLPTN
jgi:pimeloyl-ACP methyl ester carboxylesterase